MKCCLLPSRDLSVFIVAECCVFDTLWGYKGGGNVCCYKGILSFHLLLPFEKHRSVCFEVYLHFYIVHCSLYCHVHIDPKDEFNNI